MPFDQTNSFSFESILTSGVFISFATSFRIYDRARGAFFLNWMLWVSLCRLTVVSSEDSFKAFFYLFSLPMRCVMVFIKCEY